MTELRFAKYHGTGNDFVMVEDLAGELELSPEAIAAICHRRFGVGGDGLIRVLRGEGVADFFMDYSNADGTTAEMCGNGIRCLGKLVYDGNLTDKTDLIVDTRGGLKYLTLDVRDGRVAEVTVDMGPPRFTRADIPMRGPAWETFQMEPVEAGGRTFKGSALSMGNPHLVLFIDGDPADVDVGLIGPALENDDLFPEKTNVEFVVPGSDGILNTRVWERGSGETMACGTGACAVLVAANEAGLAPPKATVRFPGGDLSLERRDDGNVTLTGPAVMVFDGVLTID
ncbi:MAG: diaminopimelate epimerase [Actinomycetota bacterium]